MLKTILKYLKQFFIKEEVKPIEINPQKVLPKKPRIKRLPKCPTMLKTSYDEQIAKREAEKMSKGRVIKLRAYRCQFCPHWHLTHKKNKLNYH